MFDDIDRRIADGRVAAAERDLYVALKELGSAKIARMKMDPERPNPNVMLVRLDEFMDEKVHENHREAVYAIQHEVHA